MRKYIISFLIIAATIGLGYQFYSKTQSIQFQGKQLGLAGLKAVVYKTAACGCCSQYISYLSRFGIDVERRDVADLPAIKEKFGVPASLESCHTTVIGDYVVEGHIPVEAIAKLLKEKPAIRGIAMPGMPSGSPGMPGSKEDFNIYRLDDKNYDLFETF